MDCCGGCAHCTGVDTQKIRSCSAVTRDGKQMVALVEMLEWVTDSYPSVAFRAKRSPEFLNLLRASLNEEGQEWIARLSLPFGMSIGEDSGDGYESPIAYFRRIQSFKKPVWVQKI